jgi:hypothetical protein
VFAADLSIGVGDRVRVDGEISRPQIGEDGFDYGRYLARKSIVAFKAVNGIYSPNLVEGSFVELRLDGVLRNLRSPDPDVFAG